MYKDRYVTPFERKLRLGDFNWNKLQSTEHRKQVSVMKNYITFSLAVAVAITGLFYNTLVATGPEPLSSVRFMVLPASIIISFTALIVGMILRHGKPLPVQKQLYKGELVTLHTVVTTQVGNDHARTFAVIKQFPYGKGNPVMVYLPDNGNGTYKNGHRYVWNGRYLEPAITRY